MRNWLKDLPAEDRRVSGVDIKDVEFAWPYGFAIGAASRPGFVEVRSSLPQRRIARVIFCVVDGQMILLNGFIKKTQKTPPQEIGLALKRMKGLER